MMKYTLQDAHDELAQFLNVPSLKDRPELVIEFYKTQLLQFGFERVINALKDINKQAGEKRMSAL